MTAREATALEKLLEKLEIDSELYLSKSISLTRELPGETGRLLVEIDGDVFRISAAGKTTKVG